MRWCRVKSRDSQKRCYHATIIAFHVTFIVTLAKYLLANGEPARAIQVLDGIDDVGRITQDKSLKQLMIRAEAYAELRNWDAAMSAVESGMDMIILGVTGAIEGVFHHAQGECLRHKYLVAAQREYAKAISFYVAGGQLERAEALAKEHFVEPAKIAHNLEFHETEWNNYS